MMTKIPCTLSIVFLILVISFPIFANQATGDNRNDRYDKHDSGIVYDRTTGLEWYAGPGNDMGWHKAGDWIKALDVEGKSWRMPSLKELESLYDRDEGPPAIARSAPVPAIV